MAKYYTNTEELKLIADAIREKGGTNAQLTFPNEFVSAIENLSTGGGTVATGNDVVFYDYDGTIVASYSASAFVQLSQLPANPTHAGLVAQGWNWSLTDAKTYVAKYGKLNIGQMYITESGATEIDVIMQSGRLEPILTIYIYGTVTVDWGDNTTPDIVTGNSLSTRLDVPHTYAQAGPYTISISATKNNKYRFYGSSQYALLRKNTTSNENRVYVGTVQHIRIGNNVEIGSGAFVYCTSLTSITIPDSVTSISSYAFQYCYSLSSITIPNGVSVIDSGLFSGCSSLSSVTIPNGVTSIGYGGVFSSCSSLLGVTIPDSVTNIGSSAFQYCYPLSHIMIPDSVTSIGSSAFSYCYSLATLTIPDSVTSIGNDAFKNCYGVAEYHILPTTPPKAGTTIFASIVSDCVIYVPAASLETYKTTENWSNYASYMQGE